MGLDEIEQTQVARSAARARNLGELSRIDGIRVPPGFCVTTEAFRRIVAEAPAIDELLDRLSRLRAGRPGGDRRAQRARSAQTIEEIAVPDDLAAAIRAALARLGEHAAYAVRSSATAEDLPTASFAGQQDTYLNVVGPAAILEHVRRCWASLFTERAVTYRLRNGFDHRKVHMAVVVQQMVFPQAAGVLFTADPVTSQPQGRVRGGRLRPRRGAGLRPGERRTSTRCATARSSPRRSAPRSSPSTPLPDGGTHERRDRRRSARRPVLTDAQVVRLAQLGRRIEAHFGRPQDIEWCLVDDDFHDRPEPADHHAVPHPGGRRRGEPRLRLRRPPADDDRRR